MTREGRPMGQYIYAWIIVAVLAALSELISPSGGQGKMTGHMRFIAGLCILAALLPTVKEGVLFLKDLGESGYESVMPELPSDGDHSYDAYFYDHLSGMTKEGAEAWVYDTLSERFSVDRQDCRVLVAVESGAEGVPVIASVNISLSGKGILANPHKIEAYVTEQLSVPCTVSADLLA